MPINEHVKRISEIDLEVKLLEKHLKTYSNRDEDDEKANVSKGEVQERIDVLKRERSQLVDAVNSN